MKNTCIHFVFTNFVPCHIDTNNNRTAGMDETLAINCQCIIEQELAAIPSVKKAMKYFKLDVGDPLSFSMVLYSRKVVGNFVKKHLQTNAVITATFHGDKSNLPDSWWLIKPLLLEIERVDSEMNTNQLWDNPSILEDYIKKKRCDSDSEPYCSWYVPLLPGYDRMRHWSPIKYLVDVLHARHIIVMTRNNVMAFICFSTFQSNGNFLISSIIDELLMSTNPEDTSFMKDYKEHGLYAALVLATVCKNESASNESAHGVSAKWRFKNCQGEASSVLMIGVSMELNSSSAVKFLKERCFYIVTEIAAECNKLYYDILSLNKKNRAERVEPLARCFYQKIQEPITSCKGILSITW
jgi:hypothetical protein